MLVFQYGSNCLENEINSPERLCGDAKFVAIAEAKDFELAFDVQSINRGCAASDIVTRPGSTVWGVLYDVPDYLIGRKTAEAKDRKSFDAIEGEGKNYARKTLTVQRADGVTVSALTYTVKRPEAGLKTNLTYVRLIVAGLREHKVEEGYIAKVKTIASTNNQEIAFEVAKL